MDEETYQPVETQIGFLWGRDAIYLTEVHYDGHDLLLEGSINGHLATKTTEKWLRYAIVFSGVLAFRSVELDSWHHLYSPAKIEKTSFAEVINSRWKTDLGGKVTPSDKHFYFSTYDDVFDIICRDFVLNVAPSV